MRRRIFRNEVIQRLSSPEQLDQLITVTSPRGWLALAGLFALLLALLAWAVLGRVGTRVPARGILLDGSVQEIAAPLSSGRVLALHVETGQSLEIGQPVADVEQPELALRIRRVESRLTDLRAELAVVQGFGSRDVAVQRAYLEERRAGLRQVATEQRQLVEVLSRQLAAELELLANGILAPQELTETRQDLSEARQRLDEARAELTRLRSDELTVGFDARRRSMQVEQRVHEAEAELAQLRDEHALRTRVISPYRGRVLERLVDPGGVIGAGQPLVRVGAPEGQPPQLRVVLYVDGDRGKRVLQGMPAQVAPSTVRPEEHGYLQGRVERVAEFPSSPAAMRNVLKDPRLADDLAGSAPAFQVDVSLIPAPAGGGGYVWTSGKDPGVTLRDGTPVTGLIVVEYRRPIELVVPGIRKFLSLI